MTDIPPHFHKRNSPEGQVSEVDLIPDGRTVAVVPNWPAPEGSEVTYYDSVSDTFARYKMVSGTWRKIGTPVTEDDLVLSDVTTDNASTSKHGFLKKLPNDATKFLDGQGNFNAPPAGLPGWVDEGSLTWAASSADKTLTFANASQPLYMVVVNLQPSGGGRVDMRLNNDSSTLYGYLDLTINGGSPTPHTGQTLITLCGASVNAFGGVLYLHTGANNLAGITGDIQSNQPTVASFMRGSYSGSPTGSLTSLTILVNGTAVTGKVHVYSLAP